MPASYIDTYYRRTLASSESYPVAEGRLTAEICIVGIKQVLGHSKRVLSGCWMHAVHIAALSGPCMPYPDALRAGAACCVFILGPAHREKFHLALDECPPPGYQLKETPKNKSQ